MEYLYVLLLSLHIAQTMGGTDKQTLVDRLAKLEKKTDEPTLPEGMCFIDENDIEITNIEQLKVSTMEIFDLTELQFDVLSLMYEYNDKNIKGFITDGKNFYEKRNDKINPQRRRKEICLN